ncbi:MAG: hypothetical protein EOP84_13955 [Verrucomicrobiaceae bacterium]|nr:MAG: hypothetical protein EOP84_13955 [Verrucomicrobiaceae bacterium]
MSDSSDTQPPLKAIVAKSVHDMKTPLSCMRTTVEILRLTAGDADRQAKAIGILDAQINELNGILENLSEANRKIV